MSISTRRRVTFITVAVATVALAMARPAAAQCEGDCNRDRAVSIDELMTGIGLALGTSTASCTALDRDRDGAVAIDEILLAISHALDGCPAPLGYPRDDLLRLNQMQVLGSHNSYHIEADPRVLRTITALNPDLAESIRYEHPPLAEQFETRGIRQIELDVFADPDGGRYSTPFALRITDGQDARLPELDVPGFKVLHVQDLDYRTTCETLIECLQQVKAWSDAHPRHVPMMILIEAKDDLLPDVGLGFVNPIEIGPTELDALDVEIRSVFAPAQLITPDDVRGERATLNEAIRLDGWPTLAQSRGRILFCLDNEGSERSDYLAGHPSLRGRVMFTSAAPPADEAGFVKLNDPIGDFDRIQDVVEQGFIVRTRADADTVQARTGDTTMREKALTSGAQFVSTDYPVPDPDFGTGYMVAIPDGMPARCNPISAPAACTPLDIENPEFLAAP